MTTLPHDSQDPVGEALALANGKHIGPERGMSIAEAFREFDDANPQVYDELVRLARLWKERRGTAHLGIKTIYEVCRWNLALSTAGDPFKLNNNYTALYARKIMKHEEDLAEMFFTRKLNVKCRCSRCAI